MQLRNPLRVLNSSPTKFKHQPNLSACGEGGREALWVAAGDVVTDRDLVNLPIRYRHPLPVGACAGNRQLPKAVASQRPARIPVIRDISINENNLVKPITKPVRNTRDHHPAIAMPTQRERRSVTPLNNLSHLINMTVQIRRPPHIARPFQLEPSQRHRLNLMTTSPQLNPHRVEHPPTLPPTRHHHEFHNTIPV